MPAIILGKSGDPKKHKDVASSDSGPAENGGQACQPMGQHRQVRGLYRHSSTLPSWVAPLSQCLCQSFYLILSSGQALVGRNADFFFHYVSEVIGPQSQSGHSHRCCASGDNFLLETPSTKREVCMGIQPVLLGRLDQFP